MNSKDLTPSHSCLPTDTVLSSLSSSLDLTSRHARLNPPAPWLPDSACDRTTLYRHLKDNGGNPSTLRASLPVVLFALLSLPPYMQPKALSSHPKLNPPPPVPKKTFISSLPCFIPPLPHLPSTRP